MIFDILDCADDKWRMRTRRHGILLQRGKAFTHFRREQMTGGLVPELLDITEIHKLAIDLLGENAAAGKLQCSKRESSNDTEERVARCCVRALDLHEHFLERLARHGILAFHNFFRELRVERTGSMILFPFGQLDFQIDLRLDNS